MSGFRDIKRKMRRDLQNELQVPALYLRTRDAQPQAVHVRVRLAFNKVGAIQGARIYPAEQQNTSDEIRFDMTEFVRSLENKAIVSIAQGEAYRIDNVLPADDEFQTAEVVRLSASEAAGLPLPSDD